MEHKILEQFGFSINKDFINKLSNPDEEFIKAQIKGFEIIIIDEKKDSYLYFYDKDCNKIKNRYLVNSYISQGTYNKTYNVTNCDTNNIYVYRILMNKIESFNTLVFNITEYFIHSFLYSYFNNHKEYGKNKIVKIIELGYSKTNNLIASINEKMNGTLFYILTNKEIEHSNKISILVKALYQIINLLEILQETFQFIHNDLKADNIFFKFVNDKITDKYSPKNIEFYLGDFDASTLIINKVFIGNIHLSPEKKLQRKKDMFLLINSLFYSFNTSEWKTSFFDKFPIITKIANDEKIFHSLYSYKDENIDDVYLLNNLKNTLDKNFLNTEIKKKFEINYN
jgi:hypothetical protein